MADTPAGSLLQEGMIGSPPELATGEREIAILVDAETGVAGKISPGSIVDIVATFAGDEQQGVKAESNVVVPGARIIDVGQPELKGGNGVQEQAADPAQVVPVTFALEPREALTVTYAESFAAEVRLALLRPGEESELKAKQRVYRRPVGAGPVSQRLLIAIGDPDLAGAAAALASESDELEVVERVSEPEELPAPCAGSTSTSSRCTTRSATVPVMEIAREIAATLPRGRDGAARGRPGARADAHRDADRHPRRRHAAALARAARVQRRAAAQWSRALRERVSGEETAVGALAGNLIAVAGAKGGVGSTTVAIHLALAAARNAPGRPVCLVDFDLQKGDMRAYLDTPYRRSVVDLVEVADEISVRHLQETLFTHREGVRLLLAPDEGERAEEVDSTVARNVLGAVRARHALTVVDLGATVSEASAIGAEMASKVVVVSTPDVVALRGVRRLRDLWRRLQVREDDQDTLVLLNQASRKREVQPDLARKVVGGRLAETTIPADFAALEAAVNTGSPARLEDQKLRGAFEALATELEALPDRRTTPPRPTASRAACSPGCPASAARPPSSSPGSCRCC